MEPRPVGRGMSVGVADRRRPLKASMEPRPVGRGMAAARGRSAYMTPASMEPRPVGRGMGTPGLCRTTRRPRVNGAAAGWPRNEPGSDRGVERLEMRQWSRGRLAAECMVGRPAAPPRNAASMEPRPVGRGMIPGGKTPRGRPPSVNGAAAGWPRNGRGRHRACGAPRASMEPRPVGRGMFRRRPLAAPRPMASMEPRPVGRGMFRVCV